MKNHHFCFSNNLSSIRQLLLQKMRETWKTVIDQYSVPLICSFFCVMATTATGQIEIIQEAEQNYSYSGSGSVLVMSRSNASNNRTLWVRNKGDEVSWTIDIPTSGDYSLVVRYSNDNLGPLDSTSVLINGNKVGEFENVDTGDLGGGWNVFVDSSSIISAVHLSAGRISLSLRLDKSNNGVEYDKITITCCTVQVNSEILGNVPDGFDLMQNYPNPFNSSTGIRFGIPKSSQVELEVYDALGYKVAVLVNKKLEAGYHIVTFDANTFPSGVYYYKLTSKDLGFLSRSMILIK